MSIRKIVSDTLASAAKAVAESGAKSISGPLKDISGAVKDGTGIRKVLVETEIAKEKLDEIRSRLHTEISMADIEMVDKWFRVIKKIAEGGMGKVFISHNHVSRHNATQRLLRAAKPEEKRIDLSNEIVLERTIVIGWWISIVWNGTALKGQPQPSSYDGKLSPVNGRPKLKKYGAESRR